MVQRSEGPIVADVSPTSIRSRILKGGWNLRPWRPQGGFTHVDPFEDTERKRSVICHQKI